MIPSGSISEEKKTVLPDGLESTRTAASNATYSFVYEDLITTQRDLNRINSVYQSFESIQLTDQRLSKES